MLKKKRKNLLKIPETAERLNVGVRTVYRLVENGKLRAVKISGGICRVDPKDLKIFIKKHKTKYQEKFDF
jgi:excisionase family DNA binding protein